MRTIRDPNWMTHLWQRVKALFSGLDSRVTALEQGGGGGGGGAVSGVKGDAESTYRTGNVNLTAANIGAIPNAPADVPVELELALKKTHDGANWWEYLSALDSTETRRVRLLTQQKADGSLQMALEAKNGCRIGVVQNADDTSGYIVSAPESFRSVIEAQTDVGFYIDAQGYMCQRISSDT